MDRPLRIAQVAPPFEPVPPPRYGGTERIIHVLVTELDRRGHDVTTFASGDSRVPGRLVATVPEALRPAGHGGDAGPYMQLTLQAIVEQAGDFDVIHSHLEWASILLARLSPTPVVTTFHGRLDLPWSTDLLRDPPAGLVAISSHQASPHPDVPWTVIHHGLDLEAAPFERKRGDDLCFVGRIVPEKGIVEAMDIARETGRRLRIAAKAGPTPDERAYHDDVFQPALRAAGSAVEFIGELDQKERDRLLSKSHAVLMPGAWPEPFGLVAIEALACGTPVVARRIGALPETVREGIDGFFGDDVAAMAFAVERVGELDRTAIRDSALQRFSGRRMTDDYLALYRSLAGGRAVPVDGPPDLLALDGYAEIASAG